MNRRAFLGTAAASLAAATTPFAQQAPAPAAGGRLKQGVTRGVFGRGVPLEDCCRQAASVGIQGFDLVTPADWPIVKKYGLTVSMASGGGGSIANALNRTENHEKIEALMRSTIDQAAAAGVPNLITFSGNRNGMSDAQGADNCVAFLNKVKAQAEDKGVTAWNVAKPDTKWFAPSDASFMINYRVDDLAELIANLRAAGVEVLKGPDSHENGKFAWLVDPDGNKVELWEPKLFDEKNKGGN